MSAPQARPRTRRTALTAVGSGVAVLALLAACGGGSTGAQGPEPVASSSVGTASASASPTGSATGSAGATTKAGTSASATPTRSAAASSSARPTSGSGAAPTSTKKSKPRSTSRSTASTPGRSTPTAGTGGPSLSVSVTRNLDPTKQTVVVTGTGYDTSKGVYVALCVKTPTGVVPSPCGGGADTTGDGTASAWVSSNPPAYGSSLVTPYGKGGTFKVTLVVTSAIGSIDCRTTQCAIVTRNDHTRASDRSQDVQVPVTFKP